MSTLKDVPVKWKKLWEVTIWDKKFNSVQKGKQTKVISHKYLLAAELFELEDSEGNVFLLSTGEKSGFTTIEKAGDYLREGEIVSIPWGKSRPVIDVLKYYKGLYITADNRIATSIDTEILLNKYLFYWLQTQADLIDSFYRGSGIKHPSMSDVLDMLIPIPSIKTQQEIVRILDGLSEQNKALTTALAHEIDQRKKQYAYYREELFRFEGKEVELKALGDVAENLDAMRKPVKSGSRDVGNIPYYGASGIVDYVRDYIFDGDFLLVSEDGANLLARTTPIAFSVNGKCWVNNHAHILEFENDNQRKLVEYYLNSIELEPYITGAAQPKLNQKNLNKIKVPVIHQEFELERIVRLLDKFDEATKNIVAQLEKEIQLRNKQYEYYRNMLLSFPKD